MKPLKTGLHVVYALRHTIKSQQNPLLICKQQFLARKSAGLDRELGFDVIPLYAEKRMPSVD